MEPVYEPIDEDGNSLIKNKRPDWMTDPIGQPELLKKIFALYGRKRFADIGEYKAWKQIVKKIGKGLPQAWIDNCINWTKTKIESGNFIQFFTLENMILSEDRYKNWLAKQRHVQAELDRIDVPDEAERYDAE